MEGAPMTLRVSMSTTTRAAAALEASREAVGRHTCRAKPRTESGEESRGMRRDLPAGTPPSPSPRPKKVVGLCAAVAMASNT